MQSCKLKIRSVDSVKKKEIIKSKRIVSSVRHAIKSKKEIFLKDSIWIYIYTHACNHEYIPTWTCIKLSAHMQTKEPKADSIKREKPLKLKEHWFAC